MLCDKFGYDRKGGVKEVQYGEFNLGLIKVNRINVYDF